MATGEGTTFDLPFQWDDGQFVSPFVRSSEDSLVDLKSFLTSFLDGLSTDEIVVTDLGCGDGRVLFSICPAIRSSFPASSGVCGRGVDLDEALVELANQNKRDVGCDGCRYEFKVADICSMTKGDILDVPVNSSTLRRKHIVFVFLLTTALEKLEPLVKCLLPEVELFISNSWSVPYLEDQFLCKVGGHFVYRAQRGEPSVN